MNPAARQAFDEAAACHHRGDKRGAVAGYHRAIALDPHYAEAYSNMGVDLLELGAADAALAAYDVALTLNPDFVEAYNNRGNALLRLHRSQEAEADFRRACGLRPDLYQPLTNLGQALLFQNRIDEAVECLRRAVDMAPHDADVVNDLGCALAQGNRCAEALDCYIQGIRLAPDYPRPRVNYALMLMKLGRLQEGWQAYEWRWRARAENARPIGPEWDGAPLNGRTLLLFGEQGYGDSLQFIRFVSGLKTDDGQVVLMVPARLKRLFENISGLDAVIGHDETPPPYDCQMSLMSLPRIVGLTLERIPAAVPYLAPDPQRMEVWRKRLSVLPGKKVGLVWSGNPRRHDEEATRLDRRRSLRLEAFAPLAGMAGLSLVSLQKDAPEGDAMPPSGLQLADWMGAVGDFAESAALVMGLDLVVTVDTAVAHLAGALGKPVWILSRYDGCWRWLMDRDDSPWYPTARLYRQNAPGDWSDPLARLIRDLRIFCAD
ncbi:MAG TPA: tetratricopeptide repeat-containing glycosyltransferase family protein [Candidatus Sulfotelmatobacter sp.]|nr:tetratricopeptide repeat-containing glycosyltransferase family protein [Candidatus Sulfotelmatobacter sp.]